MSDWVIDFSAQSQEEQCRKKRSIYKVPPLISDLNKKAYQPQAVSFGPYHYWESQLMPMEDHKQRALLHVLDKSQVSLRTIFDSIVKVAQELKDSYDSLDRWWQDDTERFVQVMIMDGCFMLELLRVAYHPKNYYSDDDPVFSQYGDLHVMPFIRIDMLLLENQLPMLLLLRLKSILENVEPHIENLNKDILWLLGYSNRDGKYPKMGKCLHVLDLYRKSLLHTPNKHENLTPQSPNQGERKNKRVGHVVRPATELHDAGVSFMKSESKSLRDITFDDGLLKLPNFIVDDNTELVFLNLIAFERRHIPAGNDITSFFAFMNLIINDGQDIKLLSSKKIIDNFIGTDKAVANLFSAMSKDLVMEMNDDLVQVYMDLIHYYDMPWQTWRANLIQTYFKNPWANISAIAAFFLFCFSAVQTIFTILN